MKKTERGTKRITILGSFYKIRYKSLGDAPEDGWCDSTNRTIVVRNDNYNGVGDFERLMRKQLCHEVLHASLFESGLDCNWYHPESWGHDETVVDWFASQSPKIYKVFKKLDILD